MERYLSTVRPQLSDTWRADEMFLKMKGNLKYLYALMDDSTRFLIAQQVTNTKYTADVSPLLELGKVVAGKKPKTFITDGAANFHEAYLQEFWTQSKETRTEHIRHIRLSGDRNNNRMERFNGEMRQREKVTRTLKRMDSPILSGYRLYHNYVRPHEALDGRTPAEKAGIEIKGTDKWMTIIQNAAHQPKSNNPSDQP
jgi:transposase-like protein